MEKYSFFTCRGFDIFGYFYYTNNELKIVGEASFDTFLSDLWRCFMRRYLVSLLFLCIVVPNVVGMTSETRVTVTAQNDNVSATQWYVLANCASFCVHALIKNTYKATGVSLGILGALYFWEYLMHSKPCNRSHAKNLLAIFLGGGQGGFCGYCWARSSVLSNKLWPAASVSVQAVDVTPANPEPSASPVESPIKD